MSFSFQVAAIALHLPLHGRRCRNDFGQANSPFQSKNSVFGAKKSLFRAKQGFLHNSLISHRGKPVPPLKMGANRQKTQEIPVKFAVLRENRRRRDRSMWGRHSGPGRAR